MRQLLIVLALVFAPSAWTPTALAQDLLTTDEIVKALPGIWAMQVAIPPATKRTLQCEHHAIRISFEKAADGALIYQSQHAGIDPLPDGEDGISRSKVDTVAIRGKSVAIVLQYDGEERLDDKGKPVRWWLIMPDRDTFYWHREDWAAGAVTAASHRCPDPDFIG